MSDRLKIYLAGKVEPNGWRNQIVGDTDINIGEDRSCESLLTEEWPMREKAILGEHDYVGPFLYGCDHSCFHGHNSHGMISLLGGYSRDEVARRCLHAVSIADLVFCWLTGEEDYGTMVEIGYALAKGVPTAIYSDSEDQIKSHWFACHSGMEYAIYKNPVDAIRMAIQAVRDAKLVSRSSVARAIIPIIAWNSCKSPIEKALLMAISSVAQTLQLSVDVDVDGRRYSASDDVSSANRITVFPQHSVVKHKVDFVLMYGKNNELPKVKVAVECDGHYFHNLTKEQVQHDRSLDREMQAEGFRVCRFTGSELWDNAEKCAMELLKNILRWGDK